MLQTVSPDLVKIETDEKSFVLLSTSPAWNDLSLSLSRILRKRDSNKIYFGVMVTLAVMQDVML